MTTIRAAGADPLLALSVLADSFCVGRLDADAPLPAWALAGPVCCVMRTAEELSVVCRSSDVPAGVRAERGWRCLKVDGPIDFALTGILAGILAPLAAAKIGVFALSTFDTDYVLVKQEALAPAVEALRQRGYQVRAP